MTFRVGQKVVCVDARDCRAKELVKGNIYVVRDAGPEPFISGKYWVLLEGVFNEYDPRFGGELGYRSSRFRPVVERKTDISIFTEILRKASKPARAPMVTSPEHQSHD
jgi:hypothetical protein